MLQTFQKTEKHKGGAHLSLYRAPRHPDVLELGHRVGTRYFGELEGMKLGVFPRIEKPPRIYLHPALLNL